MIEALLPQKRYKLLAVSPCSPKEVEWGFLGMDIYISVF